MSAQQLDFDVTDHGSVVTLLALTPAAREWVEEFIDPNAPRFGRQIVIERRYFGDIYNGITSDGLTIA